MECIIPPMRYPGTQLLAEAWFIMGNVYSGDSGPKIPYGSLPASPGKDLAISL